jgi:uncharacterized damage-inducible protein DinB
MTPAAWRSDLALLEEMHRKLWATIAGLTSRDLNKTPGGSKVSNAAIISGLAAHDVYHAGQIQLLKRLYRSQGREGQALSPTRCQRSSDTIGRSAR